MMRKFRKEEGNLTVKQNAEEPIAPEILAKAIVDISENMRRVLSAGLTKEAIVTLIQAKTGISKRDINQVINSLESLKQGAVIKMKTIEREHCHAGKDGDCWWEDCPQEANNRANYQEYCSLAKLDDEEAEDE